MKFTQQAVIDAPIDQVDLEKWLFTLSDSEYQAAAHGHRAAGTFTEDGVRGTINVESIGGTLMVQHYHEVSAGRDARVASHRGGVDLHALLSAQARRRGGAELRRGHQPQAAQPLGVADTV